MEFLSNSFLQVLVNEVNDYTICLHWALLFYYIYAMHILYYYTYIFYLYHIYALGRARNKEREKGMLCMLKENREFKAKNKSWVANYGVMIFLNL